MDEAAIPHAVELLVGLLGLAAFVAIIARPLRIPYTVALVVAGLLVGIGASAVGYPRVDVSPELVLLVLLPASSSRPRTDCGSASCGAGIVASCCWPFPASSCRPASWRSC